MTNLVWIHWLMVELPGNINKMIINMAFDPNKPKKITIYQNCEEIQLLWIKLYPKTTIFLLSWLCTSSINSYLITNY